MTANSSSDASPTEPFYASEPLERELLYQGEILLDTPIFQMPLPSRWLLLRTYTGERIDAALKYGKASGEKKVRVLDSNQFSLEWQESKLGDFVIGVLDKAPSLVLSQNCDISTKNFIQVAPIIRVKPEDEERLERLKSRAILDAFYLAPHPPHWEGAAFVDFGLVQSVHKSYIKSIPSENHFRLSAAKVIQLQQDLTRFFGRPNAYDVNADMAPRAGNYMCLSCFYFDAMITAVTLDKGQAFTPCGTCGGVRWVPQLRSVPGA